MSMYPKADGQDSGCKVGWLFYKDKATAEKAAEIADKEGERLADKGYDFGYQSPGAIRQVKDGQFAGLYCVTIP
jgi:hypothetical protein